MLSQKQIFFFSQVAYKQKLGIKFYGCESPLPSSSSFLVRCVGGVQAEWKRGGGADQEIIGINTGSFLMPGMVRCMRHTKKSCVVLFYSGWCQEIAGLGISRFLEIQHQALAGLCAGKHKALLMLVFSIPTLGSGPPMVCAHTLDYFGEHIHIF